MLLRLQKKRKGLWMPIGCSSPWQAIFFGLKARRKNEGSLRISFSNCGAATAVHILKLPQIEWFTGVNSSHQQVREYQFSCIFKNLFFSLILNFSNEVASQVFNLICSINDNFNYWVCHDQVHIIKKNLKFKFYIKKKKE